MLITSLAMFAIARRYWRWSAARTALVWGPLTRVNAAFLVASSLKFLEGGFVPLTVGVAAFAIMATWRWGRKATFAAYAAKSTMTMAELIALHRGAELSSRAQRAADGAPSAAPSRATARPRSSTLLWERCGVLPRNMIFVEVTHPKVPYIRDNRYRVTVFDRDHDKRQRHRRRASLRLHGGAERRALSRGHGAPQARSTCRPNPAQWIVHVAHENLLPAKRMNVLRRLRFRLFVFLRLVSRPAYYAYGLGDEVRLSAEIMPVRVR